MSDYALFKLNEPMKIEKFREIKPVLEAVELTAHNMEEVAAWCGGIATTQTRGSGSKKVRPVLEVPAPMGIMFAEPGCYILKSAFGHYVPFSKTAFLSIYEDAS